MKLLIRTCLFLWFLVFAQCVERFVSPGATGGSGTSSSPYGSIQEALNAASSNDIITLYNGTYTGTSNTVLSLRSLTSITIRGYDDDPAKAVIKWTDDSTVSFINMSSNAPTVKLQGLGFTGRMLADNDTLGSTSPTIYVASGTLDMNKCRFDNFTVSPTSVNTGEVLYVFVTKGAIATIRNSDFIRGTGVYGIQLQQGNITVSTCNFVSHPIANPAGSCLSIKAGTQTTNFTITNNNFVSSASPLYFPRGNITLTGNGFYNCTLVVSCGGQNTIISSGNKFCGSSTGSCSSVSVANIRPFDGCGICDGYNTNKDCNGECWGTARGSSCTTRKTIWVSPSATGDGTARNSTTTISNAINQANYGDTIILLSGTYSGGINTAGKKGLTIRSENGIPDYDNVTISCETGPKNAFTFSNGESFDTVIQGITITKCGNDTGATPVYIGADTGATFQSVNFVNNGQSNTYGGAIYLVDGFVRVIDVTFQNNTAYQGSVVNGRASNNATKATYFSATNTRFIKNYAEQRGAMYFDGGLIEVTNSFFVQNDAASSAAILLSFNVPYVRMVNNSFSDSGITAVNAPRAMNCGPLRSDSTQSLNTFCGGTSTVSISCSIFSPTPTISGSPNGCGVCGSVNSYDCAGTCFGKHTNDSKGCCFTPSRDCDGTCFGSYRLDVNSTCCDKGTIDACNICGGNNSCLCDLNYNPFAPVCRNNGTCTPAPSIVVYGSYCNCSLSGGYFGFNCTDFNCTSPCETRGNCTAPDYCTCNTDFWEGAKTGCNTPVCKGDQNCEDRGNCTSPGFCTCNATQWTGSNTGCHTPVCSGAQDCGNRGNCTSPGFCACNTTLWTGSNTGCHTPVCSGAQDCGNRGTCVAPGECACNTTAWTGNVTGCNTPVCSGAQDCGNRGTCVAPGQCACNTTAWTGNLTGCNTPVCSGSNDCGNRGTCVAPGVCACNTTAWTGNLTGCNTPVCSGTQDCGQRGNCTSPGFCACNTTLWTGSNTGCNTPVCSGAQDCAQRGTCIAPGECSCNTTAWTGNVTGCNTPVCSGAQDCAERGTCVAPGQCVCNTTDWTGGSTGCNTPVCSYGVPTCNGGDCVAPGVCNCDGANQTSTCVSVSPSVTPSRTPSTTPSSSASPTATSSPSATASPSTGASSSPTSSPATSSSSPATSPESSPAASSTSFPSPTTTPSSGTEKSKNNPVEGPVLYAVIVIGAVAFVVLLASLIVFAWRRRRSDADFDNQLELETPSQ